MPKTTTPDEARQIGITNARTAIDELGNPIYRNAIASYRENVIDTLDELGAIDYQVDALAAFDACIEELRPTVANLPHCAEVYVVLRIDLTFKGASTVVCVFPSATLAWDLADAKNADRVEGEKCLYTVEPTKFFTRQIGA